LAEVAGMFGMNFWSEESLLTHTLRTVVIDRQGRLATNIEGNQFTAKQLGDLVRTVMARPQ
jgi:protein SCO1